MQVLIFQPSSVEHSHVRVKLGRQNGGCAEKNNIDRKKHFRCQSWHSSIYKSLFYSLVRIALLVERIPWWMSKKWGHPTSLFVSMLTCDIILLLLYSPFSLSIAKKDSLTSDFPGGTLQDIYIYWLTYFEREIDRFVGRILEWLKASDDLSSESKRCVLVNIFFL